MNQSGSGKKDKMWGVRKRNGEKSDQLGIAKYNPMRVEKTYRTSFNYPPPSEAGK